MKSPISSRKVLLQKTLKIGLSILNKFAPLLAHPQVHQYILELALASLSYDFVGSNQDESEEDLGTRHVPMGWNSVIEDPNTSKLFFENYTKICKSDPTKSSKYLECLVQLASMRRTLSATDQLRIQNIRRHVKAAVEILRVQAGLEDHNSNHHFCPWLARLKVNHQLDELINLDV